MWIQLEGVMNSFVREGESKGGEWVIRGVDVPSGKSNERISVAATDSAIEALKSFSAGDKVYVEGALRINRYKTQSGWGKSLTVSLSDPEFIQLVDP